MKDKIKRAGYLLIGISIISIIGLVLLKIIIEIIKLLI